MNVIADDIDLDRFLRAAEDIRVMVRPASFYADELDGEFDPPPGREHAPSMLLDKLQRRLEFRPAEVTVWAGYNGHRKSMLTGQLALDLLCQQQSVLLASFEMKPKKTIARMARQAWGAEYVAKPQRAAFFAWAHRLSIFDHHGTISPERCIAVCRYFAEELRGQQVFIDSLMMVCASEEHLDEQKRFMTAILRLAIETDMHIHLVAHCRKPSSGEDRPPTKYDGKGSSVISDQASNYVTVWLDQSKKTADFKNSLKPDALVTVEKQRNGEWEGRAQLWFHRNSMRFTDVDVEYVEPYAGLE